MTINEQVARFLESPAVRRINFQCGPTRVWGGGYERIAAGIRRRVSERHRIIVEANTVLQAVGCGNYNHSLGPNRVNKMMLPFLSMRSVQDRAITLHEATHALQDWCANPMMQADSEAAAYIAQMMYVHIETGRFPYELEPGFNGDVLDLFIR